MKIRIIGYKWLAVLALLVFSCSDDENKSPIPTFTTPAVSEVAMYEVNLAAFSGSHDLAGVAARLDYLKNLGVNTIWLMPIYPVGEVNSFGSPYCVKDYTNVNPELGNLENLKSLTKMAHEKGMAVILDWVANHTAWDHEWISAHPDWYTTDGNGNIVHPAGTNWQDVADLNFDNAQMRLEMIASMKYWISNANIDGFRCDAADFVPFSFWQQAIPQLRATSPKRLILLAEGARADHIAAGFDLTFDWDCLSALRGAYSGGDTGSLLTAVPADDLNQAYQKLRFTTNHDESRTQTPVADFGGTPGALGASAFAMLSGGVPLLYTGQEVGVESPGGYDNGASINWSAHPEMLTAYKRLLALYRDSEAARNGVRTETDMSAAGVVVFERHSGDDQLLVVINVRNSAANLTITDTYDGAWFDVMAQSGVSISGNLTLEGKGFYVLRRQLP